MPSAKKKNPAIKSSGATSSKASPLPDWVKDKTKAKPPPSYSKAGKEAAAAAAANAKKNANSPNGTEPGPSAASSSSSRPSPSAPGGLGSTAIQAEPVHLFPPGSKTPMNLLYEKIRKLEKEGWEKPSIEVRKLPPPVVRRWIEAKEKLAKRKELEKGVVGKSNGKGKADDSDLNGAVGEGEPSTEELEQLALGVEAGSVLSFTGPSQIATDSDDTTPKDVAYTATVVLRKYNKQNVSEPFIVKMTPNDDRLHPELRIFAETSLHAKHWAATYALFRVSTNISLRRGDWQWC